MHRWSVAVSLCLAVLPLMADNASAPRSDPELKRDYADIEGAWQRTTRDERGRKLTTTKTHRENTSTVTVTDADGKVLHSHQSEFELQRTGEVRVFKYWNRTVTHGPDTGRIDREPRRYVYRVSGDRFYEIHGILTDQESPPVIVIWERVRVKDEVTSL